MEKYVKIGIAAVILTAVAIVGAMFYFEGPEDMIENEVEELVLDEGVGGKNVESYQILENCRKGCSEEKSSMTRLCGHGRFFYTYRKNVLWFIENIIQEIIFTKYKNREIYRNCHRIHILVD